MRRLIRADQRLEVQLYLPPFFEIVCETRNPCLRDCRASLVVVMSPLPPTVRHECRHVRSSTVSVFVTSTLYFDCTRGSTTDFTKLAVGLTSAIDTVAVAQTGVTVPPLESVPLAHALSTMLSPALPDTLPVNGSRSKPGPMSTCRRCWRASCSSVIVKSTVPSLFASSVSVVSVTVA